jgi:hypothetical protein
MPPISPEAQATGGLLTSAGGLPIEVQGALTDREHLAALRMVQRRLGSRWVAPALCLGGPALIVVLNLLAGRSLAHALFANLFWILVGPLYLFVGLPSGTRYSLQAWRKANPELGSPQLYRFSEAGFELRGGPSEVNIAWASIAEARETDAVLILFTGRTVGQVLSRGAIEAAGQLDAVRALLRERLGERAHLLPARAP